MKKILIATSALAFAGSAFAADVSGYVASAYKNAEKTKSLHTDVQITVSGSKTASNGLTFGATYNIESWGAGSSIQSTASTPTKVTSEMGTSTKDATGVQSVTPTSVTTTDGKKGTDGQKATINAFVSGSFGKVEMGYHNAASRALGTDSIAVGKGVINNNAQDGTRNKGVDAITYTSPVFSGAQVAYTMTPGKVDGKKKAVAMAAKYSTNVSGLGVAATYATYEDMSKDVKKITAYGLKVTKDAFSVSYSESKQDGAKDKSKRIGVGYSAGKVMVGYSNKKMGNVKDDLIIAKYMVASGLTAFVENTKSSGNAEASDNTKTTWVGTTISF